MLFKADPRKREHDRELAYRFGIRSYPTIVVVAADGSELDRIVGYHGPDDFLTSLEQIDRGDTFEFAERALDQGSRDHHLLDIAVRGEEERGRFEDVVRRIEAFHRDEDIGDCCRTTLWQARYRLVQHYYDSAADHFLSRKAKLLFVNIEELVPNLMDLVAQSHERWIDDAAMCRKLNDARRADVRTILLDLFDHSAPTDDDLLEVASAAQENGSYDLAYEAYQRLIHGREMEQEPWLLENAAFAIYRSGVDKSLGLEWGRIAYERRMEEGNPSMIYAVLLADKGQLKMAADLQREVARQRFDAGDLQGVGWNIRLIQQIYNAEILLGPAVYEAWPCE